MSSKIGGITFFNYYRNLPRDRSIIIVGEYHNRDVSPKKYPTIDDYILKHIQGDNTCLDYFIESPYHSFRNGHKFVGGSLKNSRYFWMEKCGANYDACENLRIHYFDARQILTKRDQKIILQDYYLPSRYKDYFSENTSLFYHPLSSDFLNDFSSSDTQILEATITILGDDYDEFIKNIYSIFRKVIGYQTYHNILDDIVQTGIFDHPDIIKGDDNYRLLIPNIIDFVGRKIQKEIRKLDSLIKKDKFIDDYLECWMENSDKNGTIQNETYRLVNKLIDDYITTRNQALIKPIKTFFFTLIDDMGLFVTDIYLLSRIFIKFSKKTRYFNNCPNHTYTKNIVVYAGELHSEIYSRFIEKHFDIMPEIEIKSDRSYINIPEEFKFFGD